MTLHEEIFDSVGIVQRPSKEVEHSESCYKLKPVTLQHKEQNYRDQAQCV